MASRAGGAGRVENVGTKKRCAIFEGQIKIQITSGTQPLLAEHLYTYTEYLIIEQRKIQMGNSPLCIGLREYEV